MAPEKKLTVNLDEQDYKKIAEIDETLKHDPDNVYLLLHKAFIYSTGYDDENCIKIYEYLIKKYPKYVDTYFWLAYYYWQIGNIWKGIDIAKLGLNIDPNRSDLFLILAWCYVDYPGHEKEFLYNIKKIIQLEPSWISSRISLIYYLFNNKKFDDAKKEIANGIAQINDNLSIPKDEMQYRYESYVTGRTSQYLKSVFSEYLKKIEAEEKK